MKKSFLSVFTVIMMALALLTPGLTAPDIAAAATPSDISNHWAKTYITRGIELGFISGYPDGTFLPDRPVSRAEFAKMMNSALGNTATATITFKDVPFSEWYYKDVSKAVAATYVAGYDDGTFLPNKAISRQEASVMIARIIPAYGVSATLTAFKDGSSVADWANPYMKRVVGKGYLGAYDDGLLHPTDSLTRAQTAKIICEILDEENIIDSSTTIKSEGTVKDRIYVNNLTLSEDLGDGDVTLSNCVVLGTLNVNGGGLDTVTLQNCRIANCNVEKDDSAVRVLAKGETVIAATSTEQTATLQTSSLAGGAFGAGFTVVNVKSGADITFTGDFPLVNILGDSTARLDDCDMTKMVITYGGRNSDVHLSSDSTLGIADVNGVTAFHGTGVIKQMNVNVSGITYETKPRNWTIASGVKAPTLEIPVLTVTFNPTDGKTGVSLTISPTITFNSAIETYAGADITNTYLKNNIIFKKDSSAGADVAFTASMNSSDTVITIDPTSDLVAGQVYYIAFNSRVFRVNSTDENITSKSFDFTTTGTSSVVFNPSNGKTGVALNVKPTITFNAAIETYAGSDITSSYLNSNLIFKKNNSSGENVPFTASINSADTVITISPTSNLLSNQVYYLGFNTRVFRINSSDQNITSYNASFTTLNNTPTVAISPSNGATQVSTSNPITLTFSENIYNSSGQTPDTSYLMENITVTEDSSSTNQNTSCSLSGNVVTINAPAGGWQDGGYYTITVLADKFKAASGSYVASKSSTFIAGTAAPTLGDLVLTPGMNSISISATSTIPGTAYFIATTSNSVIPTASQIKSGRDATNTPCPSASGSISTSGNFTINGLAGNIVYYVYGVVNGNGSDSNILGVDVTTLKPLAVLSGLSYNDAGSGQAGSVSISSNMTINVPSNAAIVYVTATAASGTKISFEGDPSVPELNTINIDMTSTDRVIVDITVSGEDLRDNDYTLTINKATI